MKKTAYNPYLPGNEYVPDAEPRVFGSRVYVFGSHDRAGGTAYCLEDYVGWSAPVDDLANWQYEGVIYRKDQDPDNPDGKLPLFAPDVIRGPDGRFYLYYTLGFIQHISVAVCDTPTGAYEYYGAVRNPDGSRMTAGLPFDPAVLNDDGRIWLYYGFCPNFKIHNVDIPETNGSMVVELEQDMLTCKSEPRVMIPNFARAGGTEYAGHAFFEASSIRKIGQTYFFVYCSQNIHELCYATSLQPDQGFVYGGTIISNGDVGYQTVTAENARNALANIHGGLAEIAGQWYIFYHRHTHGTQFSRQGCAEPVIIKPGGVIDQVEMTSCGLNGGLMSARGKTLALHACNLYKEPGGQPIRFGPPNVEGPFVTQDGEQTVFVTNITDAAVVGFRYLLFYGSESTLTLSLRGKASGVISAYAGNDSHYLLGSLEVALDSDQWADLPLHLTPTQGKHPLILRFEGQGTLDLLSVSID